MITEKETRTDLGKIKIHTHAISSMAYIAAMEIEGVLRIYRGPAPALLEFFGKDAKFAAVKISLRENNEIDISIPIVVEYGQDVPRIANLVQENIKQAVEKMTGLVPVHIDVKVKGIEKGQAKVPRR
jgi:uncharacterized alkaline shock family protein YloU